MTEAVDDRFAVLLTFAPHIALENLHRYETSCSFIRFRGGETGRLCYGYSWESRLGTRLGRGSSMRSIRVGLIAGAVAAASMAGVAHAELVNVASQAGIAETTRTFSAAPADFNKDGRDDFLFVRHVGNEGLGGVPFSTASPTTSPRGWDGLTSTGATGATPTSTGASTCSARSASRNPPRTSYGSRTPTGPSATEPRRGGSP